MKADTEDQQMVEGTRGVKESRGKNATGVHTPRSSTKRAN